MSILKNKIDFEVIVAVDHANPNGDPLNGNRQIGRASCRERVCLYV